MTSSPTSSSTEFSLILPIFNEEGNIPELYQRSKAVLTSLGIHEILFINDSSKDRSTELLSDLAASDPCVKVIEFSRNFGHQIAISAGLDFARGNAVIIMDSDLQDPPEAIHEMVQKWREGYEVVYGKRHTRKDTFGKKLTAFLFYRMLRRFANIHIPEDTGDFRLMDRKAADAMRMFTEHSRFMRGLTSWVGFRQTFVLFDRDERKFGTTHYPFKKMMKLAIDGLTSFSYIPLRLATWVGFFTAGIGFLWGLYVIYRRFFLPPAETVTGWTTLVIAIFFVGGVQLIILGIMGEYIGRIYTEAQHRPLYLVSHTINIHDSNRS
ncbi:MAG: glycosyltransferase family 2 protein [Candidatus Kerfeldbacteria bacterium]|nr:glycosyltransferase family 2 protein [Candidatus Kerfeldbacteria bacterium]